MSNYRPRRIADLLKREISDIILRQLRDPRIGFVTLTRVKVTPDLRLARIYFSTISTEKPNRESLIGLNSAMEYIRSELKKRIRIRFVPNLEFIIDDSLDYIAKIEKLIARTKGEAG